MTDLLVGFVLDPYGYEGDFLCVAPVVRTSGVDGDTLAVGAIDGWFPPEARKLEEGDLNYIVRLPDAAQKQIEVGETVWALGSQAHQALMHDEVEQGVRNAIGGWPVASRGYRWTIGTRNEFLLRSGAFANQTSRILKRHLRDLGSVRQVELQRQLYSKLEGVDPSQRLPLLGLIARANLDSAKYDLLAYEYSQEVGSYLTFKRTFRSAIRRVEREIETSAPAMRNRQVPVRLREVGIRSQASMLLKNGDSISRLVETKDVRQLDTEALNVFVRKIDLDGAFRVHKLIVSPEQSSSTRDAELRGMESKRD